MKSLLAVIVLGPAIAAAGATISVPTGSMPDIDGRVAADEWSDALKVDLEGGRGLLLKRNDRYLCLAIRGASGGIGSVGLSDGDSLSILHASTGLITARYRLSDGVWKRESGFVGPKNEEGHDFARGAERQSAAYLAANLEQFGWRANVVESGPPEEMEYQVDMSNYEGAKVGLSVVFLQIRAQRKYAVAPAGLSDASVDRALVAGTAAESLDFDPGTWLSVEW